MKILQVTNFFKPSWETGGVTRVCYELSKNLVAKGHNVTVYTTDGFNSRLNVRKNIPVDIEGIKVYYFYNLSRYLVKKMIFPIPYYIPFVLKKEIKNYDVIHIHEHRSLLAVFVHYYAKKYDIPYVLQAHGSVLPFLQKQMFKKIFDTVFGYDILKDASKVIALNETEASQYKKMGVNLNKIEIVPNGIDLSEYNLTPKKGSFRAKYSIPKIDKIILYVGRIHKNKGIDLLVDSYSILIKKIPTSKLVIVGPDDGFQGELEQLCEKLDLKKKVLFTGFVDKETKTEALSDSDVFVTPNYSGFPVSFLEACAFGLPIITTKRGDNLDWIHEKVGFIVEYDKFEMSEAMFNVLNSNQLRISFSENSKKLLSQKFNLDSVVKKVENLYYNVVIIK